MRYKILRLTLAIISNAILICAAWAVKSSPKISTNSSFAVIVSKKDTMQSIFARYGLRSKDLYSLLAQVDVREIENIRPGQLIHFETVRGRRLHGMKIFRSSEDVVEVRSQNGNYTLTSQKTKNTGFYSQVGFKLRKSLYADGKRNGLSNANIAEIDKVMRSDPTIDSRKLPIGTKVKIVLESGGENKQKKVIGIDVSHGKHIWTVTRFHDKYGNNFYHSDGSTAAVSFMKFPLKSYRISSPFSPRRLHPILHTHRAHLGVDLAAPKGSPVWSTAQGKVVHLGRKGGYGNTIIIRHGAHYQTVYAHLSRYRAGLKVGDTVKQKQVIGYVGSTGHATGPHLHYEMRKNGVPLDPMKAILPKKAKLSGTLLRSFQQYQSHIKKTLALSSSTS